MTSHDAPPEPPSSWGEKLIAGALAACVIAWLTNEMLGVIGLILVGTYAVGATVFWLFEKLLGR